MRKINDEEEDRGQKTNQGRGKKATIDFDDDDDEYDDSFEVIPTMEDQSASDGQKASPRNPQL